MWGEGANVEGSEDPTLECCRPLGIEVYSVPTSALDNWTPPKVAFEAYSGGHGLKENKMS